MIKMRVKESSGSDGLFSGVPASQWCFARILLIGGQRDFDRKLRPFHQLALHAYRPAMDFGDPFRDSQPQAGASRFARARLVGAIKPFTDVWQILTIDSNSRIGDLDDRLAILE